jgi:hypothetical protein
MGTVRISCCGQFYTWGGTRGGEGGTITCDKCGCVYGWEDMHDGRIRTWREYACPDHAMGDRRRLVRCGRCGGSGSVGGYECPTCKGSGLASV